LKHKGKPSTHKGTLRKNIEFDNFKDSLLFHKAEGYLTNKKQKNKHMKRAMSKPYTQEDDDLASSM